MRKTYEDFKILEDMPNWVLVEEIEKTKKEMELTVEAFEKLEQELLKESPLLVNSLDVGILTKQLHNLESYIRKAENILNHYEPSKHLTKIIKRRNKLFNAIVHPFAEEISTNTLSIKEEVVTSDLNSLNKKRNKNILKVG